MDFLLALWPMWLFCGLMIVIVFLRCRFDVINSFFIALQNYWEMFLTKKEFFFLRESLIVFFVLIIAELVCRGPFDWSYCIGGLFVSYTGFAIIGALADPKGELFNWEKKEEEGF